MHLRPRFDQEKSANSASLPRNSSHGGPAPRQSVSLSSAAGTESTRPGIAGRRFGSAPQPFLLELPFQGASNGGRISRGGATRFAWLAPGYSWSPLQGCRNGYIISPRRGWPSEPPCRGSPPWLPIRFKRGPVDTPQVKRVPKGRKRIAPGFNPGIHVAPRSSPVGTTEPAFDPRYIWVHI